MQCMSIMVKWNIWTCDEHFTIERRRFYIICSPLTEYAAKKEGKWALNKTTLEEKYGLLLMICFAVLQAIAR